MKRTLLVILVIVGVSAAGLWLSLPDVSSLKHNVPSKTAFMRLRLEEASRAGRPFRLRQSWAPLERISPYLRQAVIVAEDANFYGHHGIDWTEMRAALLHNWKQRRLRRGGSTITMQLAKNLYLSPRRNPVRKIRELLIARRLERALSKGRILELYLNLIEWGDGVFGAEAAARHYFGVPSAALTADQAALLTAIIPNPRRYGRHLASRYVQRKKQIIVERMHGNGRSSGIMADDDEPMPEPKAANRVEAMMPVDGTAAEEEAKNTVTWSADPVNSAP